MISIKAYHLLEDAWQDGIAEWCRAASAHILSGGQAWIVTAGDGHANGIKRRLLQDGVSLAGVQFLDARALRRELCERLGIAPPVLGRETLELLLRLGIADGEAGGNPGAELRALEDFAAAGWDADDRLPGGLLPGARVEWLDELRSTGSWLPAIDRQLLERRGLGNAERLPPLRLCVCGWDASFWPQFMLLRAAAGSAGDARLFVPLPRGTSELLQQGWVTALEEALEVNYTVCPSSGFVSAQAALAARLEGVDSGAPGELAAPELVVGTGWRETVSLARDFVARWLAEEENGAIGARLAIVAPARSGSSVSLVRALAQAGIAIEDELAEMPEPALAVQIQRAIAGYHQDGGMVDGLLVLLELLDEHAAQGWENDGNQPARSAFQMDVAAARRALRSAFGDVQDHRVRVLCAAAAFARSPVAGQVRAVVAQLGDWPQTLHWEDALARWKACLAGFGLTTDALEPGWTRLMLLPITRPVPIDAFWDHLARVLSGGAARRPAQTAQRFARIVVTNLEGAAGQSWGDVLFLDSIESIWPVYPVETPYLDDPLRKRLNSRRIAGQDRGTGSIYGHLLASTDRAQLDQFRFLEILENCTGALAFAGAANDPAELNKELYPNEWVLRCLVETAPAGAAATPMERWRDAVRAAAPCLPLLAAAENGHLRAVYERRRDPDEPFDDTLFDFSSLTGPDELPWSEPWSGRDLEAAWHRPASLALKQIFGVEAGRDGDREFERGQRQVIGKLVHQWVRGALGGSREPRRFEASDWERAQSSGLEAARLATEKSLRGVLGVHSKEPPDPEGALPLWWRGTLERAAWAAGECMRSLAEIASAQRLDWVAVDGKLAATIKTPGGPLRLKSSCDVLLLDRPLMEDSTCRLIDIRSSVTAKTGASTAAKIEQGEGIPLAAMLLAALDQGAAPERTSAGIVEPLSAAPEVISGGARGLLEASFAQLAERQISLRFGQRAVAMGAEHGQDRGENLPLATTPIDGAVLEAKAG